MANRQGDTNMPAQQGERNDRVRNADEENVRGLGEEDMTDASDEDDEFDDAEDLDEEEEEGEGSF